MINPTEDNPITIHLAEGTYAPSTNGETFPIYVTSYIDFIGGGDAITILDAEQTDGVFSFINSNSNISNITITNGNNISWYGGGAYIETSNLDFENVKITNNNSNGHGGGLYISDSSIVILNYVELSDNITLNYGGGIYAINVNSVQIFNSLIFNNYTTSQFGLGGFIHMSSSTHIEG